MNHAVHILLQVGPWLLGGGACLGWVKLWLERADLHRKQEVDLVEIAQKAAAGMITDLRDESDRQREEAERLRDRVTHLEDELQEMRRQLNQSADSIAAKDAEIALLRGRLRQALALADSYEKKLTEAGVPHERPAQPFWRVDAGDYPSELEASL